MESQNQDSFVNYNETEVEDATLSSSIETSSDRKPPYCRTLSETATDDGDEKVATYEVLNVLRPEYIPVKRIGKGTFGSVWRCKKKETNKMVAIKIQNDSTEYEDQIRTEVEILKLLSKRASEELFVKFYDYFSEKKFACLVMEVLDLSLHDYCRKITSSLLLKVIRSIGRQLLTALQSLKLLGLVHGDLKPQNIMLVDSTAQTFKVKLIDFGSAIYVKDEYCRSGDAYIQTRSYRAPEITLGLPFSEAADMWSLGCIIAELFIGEQLFPGRLEYDHVGFIYETIGMPPQHMLHNSLRAAIFFRKCGFSSSSSWILKIFFKSVKRKFSISCLDDILKLTISNNLLDIADRKYFIDLLKKMLIIDPDARITAEEALGHIFITKPTRTTSQTLFEPAYKRRKVCIEID